MGLRIRSLEALVPPEGGVRLRRSLTSADLLALGIGTIIGTGIFVLTGVAAAQYAGPALAVSFLIAGFAAACAALCYAELAAMVPVAGSAYTYTAVTMGEAAAWLMGWNLVLEYTVGAAVVAAGWSGYVGGVLRAASVPLPLAVSEAPGAGGLVNLPAVAITLAVTALVALGTKPTARTTAVLVIVKLAAVFVFLVLAVPRIDPALWTPFMPFGFAGVSRGAAVIFFAFLGFDAVSTAAEETRDPQRAVPRGLLGSLCVCAALYILVTATLTGVTPYAQLDTPEPLALALRGLGYPWGSVLVATGALCGMTTVLLMGIYGQTRIFFAMARDGLLPMRLVQLHPRRATPVALTWGTGLACAALAGFVPLREIAELTTIGTLFAFVLVAAGVLILRRRRPDARRQFKCPAVWAIAPLAILSCGYLMTSLPALSWLRFGVWSAIGVALYLAYGYRRSRFAP
jgi:APA family basic amino acid/polyamine antiporter